MSPELIVFIVIAIGFSAVFIDLVKTKIRYRKLLVSFAQAMIDKNIIMSKIEKLEENKIENSNEFTIFLSQSRDWAFEYIENAQKQIKEFLDEVEPDIKHFDDFGGVVYSVHYDAMKRVSNNLEKLRKLLPSEEENA